MADIERRAFAIDEMRIETREDGAPRILGHAAIFNQLSEDLGGFREQIAAGAFAEAIQGDDIRALFNHNPDHVLGRNRAKTLALAEDARGLAIEIIPPDTQLARDLMTSMKRGDINQMSFGFSVRPNGENWGKDDEGRWIRTLTRVRLYDVSPVTYPAYTQTDVAVRSLDHWRQQQARQAEDGLWQVRLLRRRLDILAA